MHEVTLGFADALCGHPASSHDQNTLGYWGWERLTHHMPHAHYVKEGMGSAKLGHLGCRYVYPTFYLQIKMVFTAYSFFKTGF